MPTSVLGSFGLLITKGRDKRDESSCRKIQQHPDSLASGECVWAPSCRHCLLSHARLVVLLNCERLTFERRDWVGGGWYRYHYSFSYMFSIHDSLLPAVLKFSQIFLNYCILQFANFPADLPPGSLSQPARRRGATRQPVTQSLRDGDSRADSGERNIPGVLLLRSAQSGTDRCRQSAGLAGKLSC